MIKKTGKALNQNDVKKIKNDKQRDGKTKSGEKGIETNNNNNFEYDRDACHEQIMQNTLHALINSTMYGRCVWFGLFGTFGSMRVLSEKKNIKWQVEKASIKTVKAKGESEIKTITSNERQQQNASAFCFCYYIT